MLEPLQALDIGGLNERNLLDVFKAVPKPEAAPKPNRPGENPFLPRNGKPVNEIKPPEKDNLRLWKGA